MIKLTKPQIFTIASIAIIVGCGYYLSRKSPVIKSSFDGTGKGSGDDYSLAQGQDDEKQVAEGLGEENGMYSLGDDVSNKEYSNVSERFSMATAEIADSNSKQGVVDVEFN